MIILDTNVISEFMTAPPAEPVLRWLNEQDAAILYVTTITVAEIFYGLHVLPNGKRRQLLEDRFQKFMTTAFSSRVLPFDARAAQIYGNLMAARKHKGRPMSIFDGQIAAIAADHGFAVATRNVKDFADCGIELINPFKE